MYFTLRPTSSLGFGSNVKWRLLFVTSSFIVQNLLKLREIELFQFPRREVLAVFKRKEYEGQMFGQTNKYINKHFQY